MSLPRMPRDVAVVRSAVKFLRHHHEADNGLGEVADLLEDIADGRWSLVSGSRACLCQSGAGPVCPGCRVDRGVRHA